MLSVTSTTAVAALPTAVHQKLKAILCLLKTLFPRGLCTSVLSVYLNLLLKNERTNEMHLISLRDSEHATQCPPSSSGLSPTLVFPPIHSSNVISSGTLSLFSAYKTATKFASVCIKSLTHLCM